MRNRGDKVLWISTATMLSDCLTNSMKPDLLVRVLQECVYRVELARLNVACKVHMLREEQVECQFSLYSYVDTRLTCDVCCHVGLLEPLSLLRCDKTIADRDDPVPNSHLVFIATSQKSTVSKSHKTRCKTKRFS